MSNWLPFNSNPILLRTVFSWKRIFIGRESVIYEWLSCPFKLFEPLFCGTRLDENNLLSYKIIEIHILLIGFHNIILIHSFLVFYPLLSFCIISKVLLIPPATLILVPSTLIASPATLILIPSTLIISSLVISSLVISTLVLIIATLVLRRILFFYQHIGSNIHKEVQHFKFLFIINKYLRYVKYHLKIEIYGWSFLIILFDLLVIFIMLTWF